MSLLQSIVILNVIAWGHVGWCGDPSPSNIDIVKVLDLFMKSRGFHVSNIDNRYGDLAANMKLPSSLPALSEYCGEAVFDLISPFMSGKIDPAALANSPLGAYLDAWGKPPNDILRGSFNWYGGYASCEKIANAAYCVAGTTMFSVPFYAGNYGFCVPKQCNETDAYSVIKYAIAALGISQVIDVPPSGSFVQSFGAPVVCPIPDDLSAGAIAAISLIAALACLCLLGSLTEAMEINRTFECFSPKKDFCAVNPGWNSRGSSRASGAPVGGESNEEMGTENKAFVERDMQANDGNAPEIVAVSARSVFSIMDTSKSDAATGSGLASFLACFSLSKNTKAILSTSATSDSIHCLHGIRVFSIAWVILGHCYYFLVINNVSDAPARSINILQRFSFQVLANAFVSVDSFFFLSGLLVAYLSMKKLEQQDRGKFFWLQFYVHRFFRLTPSYMFVIFLWSYLFPYIGSGPNWFKVQSEGFDSNCKKYWWTNLLYINNLYPKDLGQECLGWSWYLANDMQFFIISPIVLISMLRYKLRGALISTGVLCLVSFASNLGLIYGKHLPVLISSVFLPSTPDESRAGVGEFSAKVYITPWCRIQPYLVGLLLGYLLQKKWTIPLTGVPRMVLWFVCWTVAFATGLSIIYCPYSVFKEGGKPWSIAENSIYGTFHRFAWGVALAWVVYACHRKMAGFVNSLLSWRAFIPLSRLTYGAYLIHPIVLQYYFISLETPFSATDTNMVFLFLAVITSSYALAFVLALLVDFPVLNLEKKIF